MYEAEPICDTVDMNVHTNGGKVESDGDGEVGGFASNPWKLAKFLNGVRENIFELFVEDAWKGFEVAGFVAIEANGIDDLCEFFFG